jgi:hypothetical protein
VLQRLDRLTKEELQMTATQTLEVVNGLFKDMKMVIDGMETLLDVFIFIVLNVCPSRSERINGQYSRGSWYDKLRLGTVYDYS